MNFNTKILNLRYFFLQILFWGAAVIHYAYMTQILEFKGFSELEIGILSGSRLLTGLVFQIWIGAFADRYVYRFPLKNIIAVLSIGAGIFSFLLWRVGHHFVWMLIICMGLGVTFTTVSPLIDSLSMLYVNHGKDVNFAKGRAGGSISWAFLCILAGIYCDKMGLDNFPLFAIGMCFLMGVVAFSMPWQPINSKNRINGKRESANEDLVWSILRNYKVYTVFLIGSALMFMGYNLGSVFLIDIFKGLGGNNTHYGIGEFVLAISEVPSAFLILKFRKKIPMKWFMLCCAFFMTLKNLIPTISHHIGIVILAQACEMLGFGLYYAGGMYLVADMLPKKDLVKATTLISVATVGMGEGLASLVCGMIHQKFGLYGLMKAGTLVNALAVFVMFFMCMMKEERFEKNTE